MPQSSVMKQPSDSPPQFLPCIAQLVGVQPQTPAMPLPPQVWGAVHMPHISVPPQPSSAVPQFLPSAAHVVGVHPHTFVAPLPPHV
jgi:hypothetical protein